MSNIPDTQKPSVCVSAGGTLVRSSNSELQLSDTADIVHSFNSSNSSGITDTDTVVQDPVISEASLTNVNERVVLCKENRPLTQSDSSTDITKVKVCPAPKSVGTDIEEFKVLSHQVQSEKLDSAESITIKNRLPESCKELGDNKKSVIYNSTPHYSANTNKFPLVSEVTSKSQLDRGTKDKTCASETLSQGRKENTTSTNLQDKEIKDHHQQKRVDTKQNTTVVRTVSTSQEVKSPSDSEETETSDSDSNSSSGFLIKVRLLLLLLLLLV